MPPYSSSPSSSATRRLCAFPGRAFPGRPGDAATVRAQGARPGRHPHRADGSCSPGAGEV